MPQNKVRAWREDIAKMSRPEIARRLGLHYKTVANYEEREAPKIYRLACAAMMAGLDDWDWQDLRRADLISDEQMAVIVDRLRDHLSDLLEDMPAV